MNRGLMGYPAAPVADPADAWREAAAGHREGGGILYIHIPFCRSRCTFCSFYTGGASAEERGCYVKLLAEELRRWSETLRHLTVNTVYFGGGTPSDLAPDEITLLLAAVRRNYRLTNDCEITLESRIDGFDEDRIDAALAGGVNRFSLGVQTFNTALRRKLGRVSDRETILGRLAQLASRNQAAVTADILYGLPGETPDMLLGDLETMLTETELSGFSFYRLHVHDRLRLARQLAARELPPLPGDDGCFELFRLGEERMAAAGAKHLSFKHFAFHPRERNLHNEISAWKVPCLPFGMGAGGRLGSYRFKQTSDPAEYRRLVEAGAKPLASAGRLPDDFPLGGRIAGQLNCRMAFDVEYTLELAPAEARLMMREAFAAGLAELEAQGRFEAERHHSRRLTARGRFDCAGVASKLMELAAAAWHGGEER